MSRISDMIQFSELNTKQSDGLRRFLQCIDEGFTGKLVYDFRGGTPQLITRPQPLGEHSEESGDLTHSGNGSR